MARGGLPVVAQARDGGALVHRRLGADGPRDDAADDRLGDHLALHATPRPGGDGRARRPGGGRAGRFLLGFGTSKIFLNNIRSQTKKTLGPMRDAVEIVRGVLGGTRSSTRATRGARPFRRSPTTRTRRATCRPSTSPPRHRRCRRWPARSRTAASPRRSRRRRSSATPARTSRPNRHRLHGRRVDPRLGPRRGA